MQYDFNLQPNGGQTIEVVGRFVTYKEGLGKIRVKLSKGGFVDLVPGQGVEDVEFTQITINDLSGNANKGSVLAGAFKFRDATIAGAVSVIDGGRYRTESQAAFLGSTGIGAGASLIPAIQLYNPAGSLKNMVIGAFSTSLNVAGSVYVVGSIQQLATSIGSAGQKYIKAAAAVSAGTCRTEALGGAPSNIAVLYTAAVSAGQQVNIILREPIVLAPGYGVIIYSTIAASTLFGAFEFFEVIN